MKTTRDDMTINAICHPDNSNLSVALRDIVADLALFILFAIITMF